MLVGYQPNPMIKRHSKYLWLCIYSKSNILHLLLNSLTNHRHSLACRFMLPMRCLTSTGTGGSSWPVTGLVLE